MRSHEEVHTVRELIEQGLNNCEISRRTAIPVSTIRGWRCGRCRAATQGAGCVGCGGPAHAFDTLPSDAYAYLLGQYLGDGHVAHFARSTQLRIACCDDYPCIVDEVAAAVTAVLPGRPPSKVRRTGCTSVGSYSRAWPCLFPQHGPGPKHAREIRLTDWQIEHCERSPRMLLRGLIHSDGCRCINRVKSKAGKTYEYPRYFFDNKSDDILMICAAAFQRVGVEYRWTTDWTLSVARREDVALLDTFIGPKS